jgi:hypothetical protein
MDVRYILSCPVGGNNVLLEIADGTDSDRFCDAKIIQSIIVFKTKNYYHGKAITDILNSGDPFFTMKKIQKIIDDQIGRGISDIDTIVMYIESTYSVRDNQGMAPDWLKNMIQGTIESYKE